MNKKTDTTLSGYKTASTKGKLAEIHFFVPQVVSDKFRRIAKKSKMSAGALFEDMIDTYSHGMNLD